MIIQLEIPSVYKNDRFDEFFKRAFANINCTGVHGNYEAEAVLMMADAKWYLDSYKKFENRGG